MLRWGFKFRGSLSIPKIEAFEPLNIIWYQNTAETRMVTENRSDLSQKSLISSEKQTYSDKGT